MTWLIVLLLVVILLTAATWRQGDNAKDCGYELNGRLFSPAERSFYGILKQAVGEEAVVLGKVRVADILRPSRGGGRRTWQRAFNRISSKHFDYVICSPDTLEVLSAVELDDKSHAARKRAERDRIVEDACAAAGLSLHRFKAGVTYNVVAVRNVLFPPRKGEIPQEDSGFDCTTAMQSERPVCPKCASALVRKVAKKGRHKGAAFIACSAYPKCRYIEKQKA